MHRHRKENVIGSRPRSLSERLPAARRIDFDGTVFVATSTDLFELTRLPAVEAAGEREPLRDRLDLAFVEHRVLGRLA